MRRDTQGVDTEDVMSDQIGTGSEVVPGSAATAPPIGSEADEMVEVTIDLSDGGKYPGNWLHWRLCQEAERRGLSVSDLASDIVAEIMEERKPTCIDGSMAAWIRGYFLRPQHWTTFGACPSEDELSMVIALWFEWAANGSDPATAPWPVDSNGGTVATPTPATDQTEIETLPQGKPQGSSEGKQ